MALTTSPNASSIVLIIHVGQHVKGFRDTSQGREGGNAATQRPSSASIFDHGIEMMQLDPFRQFGPFFFTQTDHIELLHNHPSQLWPQLTGRQLIMPVYDVE